MPASVRLAVNGVQLSLRVWSARERARTPVLMLPATGETAADWDDIAKAVSQSRCVYAVDLRGHGDSDWPGDYSIELLAGDVAGLLPQLGSERVDLVGHSLGGLVAARVASSNPRVVRRLVLEDVGVLRPRPADPPARPPGSLAFDWRIVEQVRPEIDSPDPGWPDVFAGIAAPTLVIAGGPSSPVPARAIEELVSALPNGRFVTIDAGHLVHATEPVEFAQELLAFLDAGPID